MNTKAKNLKIGIIVLMTMILITSFPIFSVSASSANNINLALDVMFVIDGSGSMLDNDPNGIAKAACNLFSDMCDYEQARVGYVVYQTEIVAEYPLTRLSPDSNRQAIKASINNIQYRKGWTDISLGLTRAKNMLIEGGAMAEDRSPMIILLSDGRTEGISEARAATYDSELTDTLAFLENNAIPVYTIALTSQNFETDVQTMEAIANATDAKYFSTDNAGNLSQILSEIMAHRLRSNIDFVANVVGNGEAQTVEVNIPNDSIYQANIIIFSQKGVTNVRLHEPSGNEVVVPSNKVLLSHSPSYDLIKLIRPSKGPWKLTLTGADKDFISINLINCYDIQFGLKADRYTIANGDAATFTVYCSSLVDGETDTDIFNGAEGVLTITNTVTGDTKEVNLTWNGTELGTSHTFNKAGTYKISGRIIGKDGSYDRATDEITVEVTPYPLTAVNNVTETSGTCFSPFLGIRINNKVEKNLVDLFSWDADATVTVTPTPGGWENICDFAFDETTNTMTITANRSGNATIDLTVTDSFGQTSPYTAKIRVIPGWLPVVLFILGAGIVVLIIFLIKKIREPKIKGKLKISVSLPSELAGMTPPEADIDLSILNKKGKVPLTAVLASNLTLSGAYTQALDGISGFVQKLYVEAANSDCSALWIYIPSPESGANLQFNNAPIDKKAKKSINSGMPATLNHSSFNGSYVITFNFGEDGWSGGGGDMFGGNNGGFNGFGGGNDNSSFGGFGGFGGGGSDNSSFGGFGGGSNDNSSFGGFGGGSNDNSSFGGFGGGSSNDNSSFGGFGGGSSNDNSSFGGFGGNDNNNSSFNAF